MGSHNPANEPAPNGFVSLEKYEKLRKEFEEFVYIISHDLQSPLRHTREFNKLMLNSLDAESNADERVFADYIQKAITQAEAIVAGVLKCSRLNTQLGEKNNINLSNLMGDILDKHNALIDESSATITTDVLPEVYGDAAQIEQLISILIENSLKFQNPEVAPEIKLSSKPVENGHQFSIEDNGVGMNSDTRKVAFNIFRPVRKYNIKSGIGIGLTMAKNIVENHGGNIWVDAEYSNGTRIYFTLATEA